LEGIIIRDSVEGDCFRLVGERESSGGEFELVFERLDGRDELDGSDDRQMQFVFLLSRITVLVLDREMLRPPLGNALGGSLCFFAKTLREVRSDGVCEMAPVDPDLDEDVESLDRGLVDRDLLGSKSDQFFFLLFSWEDIHRRRSGLTETGMAVMDEHLTA
jgi:hypothetical protein